MGELGGRGGQWPGWGQWVGGEWVGGQWVVGEGESVWAVGEAGGEWGLWVEGERERESGFWRRWAVEGVRGGGNRVMNLLQG